mmetsp:Transcript_61816/g.123887  ORF Transcript_61816/g.123887 Transcript_61816/m.123887 type:complete len:374 (+) Transcript_61816:379-1500(+)
MADGRRLKAEPEPNPVSTVHVLPHKRRRRLVFASSELPPRPQHAKHGEVRQEHKRGRHRTLKELCGGRRRGGGGGSIEVLHQRRGLERRPERVKRQEGEAGGASELDQQLTPQSWDGIRDESFVPRSVHPLRRRRATNQVSAVVRQGPSCGGVDGPVGGDGLDLEGRKRVAPQLGAVVEATVHQAVVALVVVIGAVHKAPHPRRHRHRRPQRVLCPRGLWARGQAPALASPHPRPQPPLFAHHRRPVAVAVVVHRQGTLATTATTTASTAHHKAVALTVAAAFKVARIPVGGHTRAHPNREARGGGAARGQQALGQCGGGTHDPPLPLCAVLPRVERAPRPPVQRRALLGQKCRRHLRRRQGGGGGGGGRGSK